MDEKQLLEKTIAFHGHFCPGLTIGFRAALIGLRELGVQRAQDEELVAIAETDACGVDAIQVLTGCTMGKGNLILRDWGKQVFSLGRRSDGRMVRVALRYEALNNQDRDLPDAERRAAMLERMQQMSDEELFDVRWVEGPLPERARIMHTIQCSQCKEGVMEARVRLRDGQPVCPQCYGPDYTRFC
ncbi:MAG: formylmethanofuran dehydrogenase [Chloroflexi bacterium]|jgi:formylmethanofuran dehydrogenase subunit E|nr:formylmethanofuran dehydrogenase [Chloroflexota bacterium]